MDLPWWEDKQPEPAQQPALYLDDTPPPPPPVPEKKVADPDDPFVVCFDID